MREGEKRGFAPKSFMSRAESHEVGGDGRDVKSDGWGELSVASQSNGEAGEGEGDEVCLSFKVMVVTLISYTLL